MFLLMETLEPNQESYNQILSFFLLLSHWLGAPAHIWLGAAGNKIGTLGSLGRLHRRDGLYFKLPEAQSQ